MAMQLSQSVRSSTYTLCGMSYVVPPFQETLRVRLVTQLPAHNTWVTSHYPEPSHISYAHSLILVITDNTLQSMIHCRSHTKRQLSLQKLYAKKKRLLSYKFFLPLNFFRNSCFAIIRTLLSFFRLNHNIQNNNLGNVINSGTHQ
jgi:hypothetical protein